MAYDSPDYLIRREHAVETAAGAAAVSAKFMQYQAFKLKAFHVQVTTAGTSAAAGNCLILKSGTTALATATLGSSTAGVTTSITINTDVPSLTAITCTNGTDATGKALVVYEYETLSSASESA